MPIIASSASGRGHGRIYVPGRPNWTTAAGNLATINDKGGNYSPISTVTATAVGLSNITYAITSGSIPAGCSFNTANGQVTGTPNNVASQTVSSFTVTPYNYGVPGDARTFTITVNVTLDGTTSARANTSAVNIKSLVSTSTNGMYWITIGGTPTNVYCNMQQDGGGWIMVAKMINSNPTSNWSYTAALWTNTSLLNDGQNGETYGGDIKTRFFYGYPFSQVRIAAATVTNGLVENWSNATGFNTFMSGARVVSGNSRATWETWWSATGINGFSANCNQFGTNYASNPYCHTRLGAIFNGEGDCSSSDDGFGFGMRGIAPWTSNLGCGAQQGGTNTAATGWIFIK